MESLALRARLARHTLTLDAGRLRLLRRRFPCACPVSAGVLRSVCGIGIRELVFGEPLRRYLASIAFHRLRGGCFLRAVQASTSGPGGAPAAARTIVAFAAAARSGLPLTGARDVA